MTAICSHPLILARTVNRFTVLANLDRIRILLRLSQGECGMKRLCAVLGLSPSSLSHHVDLLTRAGFVEVRHLGTQSLCRVRDSSPWPFWHRPPRESSLMSALMSTSCIQANPACAGPQRNSEDETQANRRRDDPRRTQRSCVRQTIEGFEQAGPDRSDHHVCLPPMPRASDPRNGGYTALRV